MLTRENLRLRALLPSDLSTFPDRTSTFQKYLAEQKTGLRWVRVAVWESKVAGYVTLLWVSEDRVLRDDAIPEISDLKVREARKMPPTTPDRWAMKVATRNLIHPGLDSGLTMYFLQPGSTSPAPEFSGPIRPIRCTTWSKIRRARIICWFG